MNYQIKRFGFVVVYLIIAVIAWVINMQIATVIFGVFALRSIYLLFRGKEKVEQG